MTLIRNSTLISATLMIWKAYSLVFQILAQKVFWVGILGPNTSSQGVWKPRDWGYLWVALGNAPRPKTPLKTSNACFE